MTSNALDEQGDQILLGVLVDKKKNKVLFAEAGRDFVDALLSFLTLPLGTISRLIAKESNMKPMKIGSISSLYESVADLDEKYLWSPTCKEMLLTPRNSMEAYCQNVKLNVDDTEPLKLYFCKDYSTCEKENGCGSIFRGRDQKCACEKISKVLLHVNLIVKNGFVRETSTFIISDDLCVMPNLVGTGLNILQKLGVNDIDAIDKQTLNITKKEVIGLLKLSLLSKTPLSDFIFRKEEFVGDLDTRKVTDFWLGDVDENESNKITVNVLIRKSNKQVLFVEAQEDFAEFVWSFLTFPLGGVLNMLHGISFLSCIDSLYKSMNELCPDRCLMSQNVKDKLNKPCTGMQFDLKKQILPIGAEPSNVFHFHKVDGKIDVKFVDPKSLICRGFSGGPLSFMVTDELVVCPSSSISGFAYLEKMKVPLNDIEERVISIGPKEVGFI